MFDLLQLVHEADDWTVSVSRRQNSKQAGKVLYQPKRIMIYAKAHLGGDIGSMAQTLLHEQIHAHCGVCENDATEMYEREEALVLIEETLIYEALDDKRKAHLEYLLRE